MRFRLLLAAAACAFLAVPAVANADLATLQVAPKFSDTVLVSPPDGTPYLRYCGFPSFGACNPADPRFATHAPYTPVQVRWGAPASSSNPASGLGYAGPASLPVTVGTPFVLAELRHFNNPISLGTAASSTKLTLDLVGKNAGGATVFTASIPWTFTIDETSNSGAVSACPYPSVTPCSDKISFSPPAPTSILGADNHLYVVNFDGFRSTASVSGTALTDFISDEGGDRSGWLVASVSDETVQSFARDDAYETLGAPVTGDVRTNDTDVDHVQVAVAPTHGTLALNANGTFTYTPNAGFRGIDPFRYVGVSSTGYLSTANVVIRVGDFTPPSVTVPADIVLEATSPTGTPVTWTASATDNVTPGLTPACAPPSGTPFAIGGPFNVVCSATDAAGNTGSATFHVTIQDTSAPTWTAEPADVTREATSPAGAAGGWAMPTATDVADATVDVTCDRAPGDTYPLGATTVTCTATDDSGNRTLTDFLVSVQDTTDPAWVAEPADLTREADSAAGTVVTWPLPAATDAADASVDVACDHASGETYPLGATTVTCTATDDSGNDTTTDFVVRVGDTTPPSVTVPGTLDAEATAPDGAIVAFTATASDTVDGALPASCSRASGSTFPLGSTTVTCTATDAAGNTGSASFTVHVADTIAPEFAAVPADLTREATSAAGAAVTFAAPAATDLVDASVAVTCAPPSGSTFPLGPTLVTCTATDDSGNAATTSFHVTVQDTTGPSITVPSTITVNATSTTGEVVTYAASALDLVSGPVAVTCTPPSGSTFAPGTTTVSCTAADAAGNTATRTFAVVVRTAAAQVAALCAYIDTNDLGPGSSLLSKCRSVQAKLGAGDTSGACSTLQAFLNEVRAQRGKKLTAAQADRLAADATRIRAALGC